MKITAIETTPVFVPRLPAFGAVPRTAFGPSAVSEYGIVEVHTDEGLTGLGVEFDADAFARAARRSP